jgi:hypothetical protein
MYGKHSSYELKPWINRICMESSLDVLRTRRPRRRGLGRRASHRDPGRQSRRRRRGDPPPRHHLRLQPARAQRRRRLRGLPRRQSPLPGLPRSPRQRPAHRHRHHRGSMQAYNQRQIRYHRCPVGPRRRRSHPQATSPPRQRRLRTILALAPAQGTPASLRTRRLISSLPRSHTQLRSSGTSRPFRARANSAKACISSGFSGRPIWTIAELRTSALLC